MARPRRHTWRWCHGPQSEPRSRRPPKAKAFLDDTEHPSRGGAQCVQRMLGHCRRSGPARQRSCRPYRGQPWRMRAPAPRRTGRTGSRGRGGARLVAAFAHGAPGVWARNQSDPTPQRSQPRVTNLSRTCHEAVARSQPDRSSRRRLRGCLGNPAHTPNLADKSDTRHGPHPVRQPDDGALGNLPSRSR